MAFENLNLVLTGGSSGIGYAVVEKFAKEHIHMCLLGRHINTLQSAIGRIAQKNCKTSCFQIDLTEEDSIRKCAETIKRDIGKIDILIHCAGYHVYGPIETIRIETFDRIFSTNFKGPVLLTQALLPLISKAKGEIVFMNSSAAFNAPENAGIYSASKSALKIFADSLRKEVNSRSVRILSIYPGRTATPIQEEVCKSEGKIYYPEKLIQPADIATAIFNSLRLPRTVETTDIHVRPMQKY